MRKTHSQSLLRALLEPKALILLIALLHFLRVAIYIAQELQTENGRSADAQLYLFGPFHIAPGCLPTKENACQANALSPPIEYCHPIMCLTERHTPI
jgi:hypothetical protein